MNKTGALSSHSKNSKARFSSSNSPLCKLVFCGFAAASPMLYSVQAQAASDVLAQNNAAQQIAARPTSTQEIRTYQVPAGPLSQVLSQFSGQAGIALAFSAERFKGIQSQGLDGRYNVSTGLAKILAGTGAQAIEQPSGSYALEFANEETATQNLEEVLVVGHEVSITEDTGSYTIGSMSTATGFNLSSRETPQSLTVITDQRMKDQNATDLTDILQSTAGINAQLAGAGTDPAIHSRGFTVSNIQYDGAPVELNSAFSAEGLADLAIYDHVEIVRGAAGILNGKGNPSAVINLVRKKPTGEFAASVSGSIGRWDSRRVEVDLSGPLTEKGNIRGRTVIAHRSNESFIDFLEQETNVFYGISEIDLTPKTLLTIGVDYQKDLYDGVTYGAPIPLFFADGSWADLPRSTSVSWKSAFNNIEKTKVFASIEQEISEKWHAKLSINHADVKNPFEKGYVTGYPDKETGEGMAITRGGWAADDERIQKNLDLSINGEFNFLGREHQLITGWNYASNDRKRFEYPNLASSNPFASVDRGSIYDSNYPGPSFGDTSHLRFIDTIDQSGYYLTGRFSITNPLTVMLGARVSKWSFERNAGFTNGSRTFIDEEFDDKDIVTPYFGIVYDLTDNVTAYGSYTSVYEPQYFLDVNSDVVDPLEGANYETGIKSAFFDEKLNASVAVFKIEQDNLAEQAFNDDNSPITIDGIARYKTVDGISSEGLEIEVSGELQPGIQVYAGYTHTQVEDNSGKRYNTFLPEDMLSLFVSADLDGMLSNTTLGGGVRWQNEISSESGNGASRGPNGEIIKQSSYAVVDMFARYQFNPQLTATLNVSNIFDKKYYERVTDIYVTYGEPRSITAKVTWDF